MHSLREATRNRFLFYGFRFSCRILADLFVFPGLHDLLVEHAKRGVFGPTRFFAAVVGTMQGIVQ